MTDIKRNAQSEAARLRLNPGKTNENEIHFMDILGQAVKRWISAKLFVLLASPTGFEPVLSP